jgi:hypothetical protein
VFAAPQDDDDRMARIDQTLEELRRNTEDLHELAKAARERARRTVMESRVIVGDARASRNRKRDDEP